MKDIALSLLRRSADLTGSGAAGLLAASAGMYGAPATISLLGVVAGSMVLGTAAEQLESSSPIARIETWLEELIRRQGGISLAINSIAEGQDSHPSIDAERAAALLRLLQAPEDSVVTLLDQDTQVNALVEGVADRLSTLHDDVLAHLKKQSSLITELFHAVKEQFRETNSRLASLQDSLHVAPSDEQLHERAADDNENCSLRASALCKLTDNMEFTQAEPFADRSDAWLQRVENHLDPAFAAELLERLIDIAIYRLRNATESQRSTAKTQLQQLQSRLLSLIPRLDEYAQNRLTSLLAYGDSVIGNPEDALRQLNGRIDPYGLRRRLAILCDIGQYESAVELIRGGVPAVEWASKAIIAATKAGDWDEADRILDWADINAGQTPRQLCYLLYADALYVHQASAGPTSDPLDEETRARAVRAYEHLGTYLPQIESAGVPRHELDCCLIQVSIGLADLLDYVQDIASSAQLLAKYKPFHTELARLALRDRVEIKPEWSSRLRSEGPSTFERRYWAAALESRQQDTEADAFESAMRLAADASDEGERRQVHTLLTTLAGKLGKIGDAEFAQTESALVDPDDRQAKLWRLVRELAAGSTEDVSEELEELRDEEDPYWLHVHGNWLLQNDDVASGVKELVSAARILDQPTALDSAASLALSHKQWHQASKVLQRLHDLHPQDRETQARLALALNFQGEYFNAAELLRVLAEQDSEDPNHAQNAALCFTRAGMPDDAIDILELLCSRSDVPLRAVLSLAHLYAERGRANMAFALLQGHQDRFWSEYEFVGTFWTVAFASEHEEAGNNAFVQMRILQSSGKAPDDALVSKSLPELMELTKEHQERLRSSASDLLFGKLPWLAVAEMRHEPAVRAWRNRTVARNWIPEDPVQQSESAVYVSNAFCAVSKGDQLTLEPIVAPPRGQPIVADLSALITLSKLDLLDSIAQYCGRLHVPDTYMFKMFADSANMQPNQPSRQTIMESLRNSLSLGHLHELTDAMRASTAHVDEHYPAGDPPPNVYHLADIRVPLVADSLILDEQLSLLETVISRPATSPEQHTQLQLRDQICVSLSTLSTLHYCKLLDTVVDCFDVHVSRDDANMIRGSAIQFASDTRLLDEHRALWEFLRDDTRIVLEALGCHKHDGDSNDLRERVSTDALHLAMNSDLPLLADDRWVQMIFQRSRPHTSSAAFDTCQLLGGMRDTGLIAMNKYADSVLTLMRYRYRFIVPGADVLMHCVSRSSAAVPGPELKECARYLHSCLRDAGLFGGQEPTSPPTTMALKYSHAIESTTGEFVGAIWCRESLDRNRARDLTRWALTHLLPSPPMNMEPRIRVVGDLGYRLFWMNFFLHVGPLLSEQTLSRVREGMACAASTLGESRETVIRTAVELIDGLRN